MLTDPAQLDAQAPDATLAKYKGVGASTTSWRAARARCPPTRRQTRGPATTCFSSGDLVEDLTHNFFLETGAATAS